MLVRVEVVANRESVDNSEWRRRWLHRREQTLEQGRQLRAIAFLGVKLLDERVVLFRKFQVPSGRLFRA